MADDGTAQSPSIWPSPGFSFQVSWGSLIRILFQEVSGLDTDPQIVEYRHSVRPDYPTTKMPGIKKLGNVTLKKGWVEKDDAFRTWYDQIRTNTIARVPVVVQLLDGKGRPTMTWTLANAYPVKVSAPTLESDGNEVAIESIEVAHEGVTIADVS